MYGGGEPLTSLLKRVILAVFILAAYGACVVLVVKSDINTKVDKVMIWTA